MAKNKLYHKELVSERSLVLQDSTLPNIPYAGLHILMRHPELKFGNLDIVDDIDWLRVAQDTIYLSMMSLVSTNFLTLSEVVSKTSILFNVFRFDKTAYFFDYQKQILTKDLFCQTLLQSISHVSNKYRDTSHLKYVVRLVVDHFLKPNKEYNRPAKYFILQLIQVYDVKEDWFELAVNKSFLGILKKYSLEMDEDVFETLVEEHMEFGIILAKNERTTPGLLAFKKELFKSISSDFDRRKPDNDSN